MAMVKRSEFLPWLPAIGRKTFPGNLVEPMRAWMMCALQLDARNSFQSAIDALKTQGFGVLTEIDVQKTLKEKLGAEMEPYVILGACNPQLARQALDADRSIGLLLPCNVVLRQEDEDVRVSILDPRTMFEVTDATFEHDVLQSGTCRPHLVDHGGRKRVKHREMRAELVSRSLARHHGDVRPSVIRP